MGAFRYGMIVVPDGRAPATAATFRAREWVVSGGAGGGAAAGAARMTIGGGGGLAGRAEQRRDVMNVSAAPNVADLNRKYGGGDVEEK